MFLKTVDEMEATGRIAELYGAQKAQNGFVMSAARAWTARPDLLPIYQEFVDRIRAGFSLTARDWRLITFVAARQVRSTYCSHVYGKQLIADLGSREAVLAVQRDFRSARLSERDVEMLRYADTIARDASLVTVEDIARLRAAGFTDVQICDIALCASFRCFVGRFFDAVGAGPEPAFVDSDAGFRDAMTVGRPIRPIHPTCDLQPSKEEEPFMATSVKQMMEAANAAVPRITPAQAKEMMAKGNTLVVDVRDAPELEKSGKVAGAIHVSRGMLEFRADPETPYHDKNFTKDKTIIVYCASGGRSALSGKVLKDMGYANVCNLGAFKDWAESGGAVEKPTGPGM